jgi:V/A-type H+-transporting ATPase subunit A
MQSVLHQEDSLNEVVKLIGSDVLPEDQKLVLEIGRVIRVGYLQQNAFHPDDQSVPLEKQYRMMKVISYLYASCKRKVEKKIPVSLIRNTGVFEEVIKIKYDVPNNNLKLLDSYNDRIDKALDSIL